MSDAEQGPMGLLGTGVILSRFLEGFPGGTSGKEPASSAGDPGSILG